MPSMHFLDQDDQNELQHDIFAHVAPLSTSVSIMWHLHQHYMMPTASSMIPLHSFGQDN